MATFCRALARRKVLVEEGKSELRRILNLLDLTALGVGSSLGLGVYVMAGSVGYNIAGPAVVISFIIAGLASLFAAICYAEFAARVPRAGSAYIYSYVSVGEFVAFSIGWNMVLEYLLGTASLARGLSGALNAMMQSRYSDSLTKSMGMDISFLARYPDFIAFVVVLCLTALLAFGVKESSVFNLVCTVLNLVTIVIVVGIGTYYADTKNWRLDKSEVPEGFGEGGFMPFGFAGVMVGAAKCFFGYVGFDGICTMAEEAINPKRNMPLSIMLTLAVAFLAYVGISVSLTLMIPYYKLNPTSPFPSAFESMNMHAIKWIVGIGSLFALTTALFGAMFPLPRVLYAMATDGLVFRFLSFVYPRTQTPIYATILAGILAAVMTLIFQLDQLVDMMSIGTLMAYSMVSICVVVLRYQDEEMIKPEKEKSNVLLQFCNRNSFAEPNILTSRITKVCIIGCTLLCLIWCIILKIFDFTSMMGIATTSLAIGLTIILSIIVALQPTSKLELIFRVPLVPWIPICSFFINVYLMFQLDAHTWTRFIIWIVLGYIIYFGYGIFHSAVAKKPNEN